MKKIAALVFVCTVLVSTPQAAAQTQGNPNTPSTSTPCTPPSKIYSHRRWRVEHPARGMNICASESAAGAVSVANLRKSFFHYADQRFRSCSPSECKLWARRFVSRTQMNCLGALWGRESGWSRTANNPSSSAHGIPQALPGSKMGPGWQDDGKVQIRWGLGYISGRYGSPCAADSTQSSQGWY